MINGCIEHKVLLKVLDFDKDIPVLVDKIAVAHFLPPQICPYRSISILFSDPLFTLYGFI
jgi:hypothetical protein